MSKANNLLAETRDIETRNEFGLSNTEAINIFEVLKYNANVSIIKMSIDSGLYGLYIKKDEVQAILININTSLGRQYFTAAHENYFRISHHALILRLKLDNHIKNKEYQNLKDINITKEGKI